MMELFSKLCNAFQKCIEKLRDENHDSVLSAVTNRRSSQFCGIGGHGIANFLCLSGSGNIRIWAQAMQKAASRCPQIESICIQTGRGKHEGRNPILKIAS